MKNLEIILCTLTLIFSIGCKQNIKIKEAKTTAINPHSYTTVAFKAEKDTALIATFSGRISERINGKEDENVIINLNDEIYSLAYDKSNSIIYAATLTTGIVVINEINKSIVKTIEIDDLWITNLYLANNNQWLIGVSARRTNYVWDIANDYNSVDLPEQFSKSKIVDVSTSGTILFSGNGKITSWEPSNDAIVKEINSQGFMADSDKNGNLLFLKQNEFIFYDNAKDSVGFAGKHQDWPYFHPAHQKTYRIPLNLELTTGLLTDKYAFTSGIDRSVRKWNKTDGSLVEDFLEHRGSISGMDVSYDETQMVSVDLKGGIQFRDVD